MRLGDLADPQKCTSRIDISGADIDFLKRALRMMMVIRTAEDAFGQLVESGHAHTPCHLGIGQEAIAVGVSSALTPRDRVFGAHRSHSHYLALGCDLYGLAAEVLGKADGASKGMGGSMHLFGGTHGFCGSVPIVGATIPLAVGAGLAAKLDGSGAVGVCYFGDGTVEEGIFHESMNLAAIYRLPVLFVCENNLYSSHLDIRYRQPYDRIARFASVHAMPSATVDGNDVVAVASAAQELVSHARSQKGPAFLEAVTYRWRGHVGPDPNVDVGVRRRKEDVDNWKKRDPVRRLVEALIDAGHSSEADVVALDAEVRQEVAAVVERAKNAPYPSVEQLLSIVYSNRSRATGPTI